MVTPRILVREFQQLHLQLSQSLVVEFRELDFGFGDVFCARGLTDDLLD